MHCYRHALLAVALCPLTAAAGPVAWDYQTSVRYASDYGDRFKVTLTPPSPMATALGGERTDAILFSSTGTAMPRPGEYVSQYNFTIDTTITDKASGESGVLSFAGGYAAQWMYYPGDPPDMWKWENEGSDFGDHWKARSLDLGGNRYSVRAFGGGPGQFPFGVMSVTVTAAPEATPEPATLALACVGLAAVGVRRLRRQTTG